jgi:hypothetical protein
MKVNSSVGTERKHAKAARNRANAILHLSINTLSARRSPVERVLVIDIGGRSVKILQPGKCKSRSLLQPSERKRAHANRCDLLLLERAP